MARSSNPFAKGRILGCVILATSSLATVYFGVAAWKWNSDFYEWVDAKPMQVQVDLTTPSRYSTPFKQTCVMAHGQSIYVALDSPEATDENIGEYFAGLQGTITIREPDGGEVLSKPFGANSVRLWSDDPLLVGFHPFQNGDYVAEIEITRGAEELQQTEYELYARNELCGLELMPAYALGTCAFVAGLISFTSGCFTLPSVAGHGFRLQPPDSSG